MQIILDINTYDGRGQKTEFTERGDGDDICYYHWVGTRDIDKTGEARHYIGPCYWRRHCIPGVDESK